MTRETVDNFVVSGSILGTVVGGVVATASIMAAAAAATAAAPLTATAVAVAVLANVGGGAGLGAITGEISGRIQQEIMGLLRGKCVQILGPLQSGKNSVYNTITGKFIEPDSTSISSEAYYGKNPKSKLEVLKELDLPPGFLKNIVELSGEAIEKWKDKIKETNPNGIIYVVDSCTQYPSNTKAEKERFYKEIDGLHEVGLALREIEHPNVCVLLILINKIDLIDNRRDVVSQYRRKLLNTKITDKKFPDITLEAFLRTVLGPTVPIRTEPFCADKEQRDGIDYQECNRDVIKQLWKDLLGGRK